jgi:hypothetical protein
VAVVSWPADGKPRYVVSELEGYMQGGVGPKNGGGLSVAIVDRANCHRAFTTWRTEEIHGATRLARRRLAREAAAQMLAELNGERVAA